MSEAEAIKNAVSVVRNRRTDAMFVAAYIASMWFVYLVVYEKTITEYAQGVLTLALGTFLGYLTAMYGFETGSTRGAQSKDSAIKDIAEKAINATEQRQVRADAVVQDIAKSVPIAAAKAVDAATVAAGGNGNGAHLKATDNLTVDATGADISISDGNVTKEPK